MVEVRVGVMRLGADGGLERPPSALEVVEFVVDKQAEAEMRLGMLRFGADGRLEGPAFALEIIARRLRANSRSPVGPETLLAAARPLVPYALPKVHTGPEVPRPTRPPPHVGC